MTATRKRTAFVTGATQGLGAALALRLAQDGYDVAVSGINVGNLAKTVKSLEAAGTRVTAVPLDLRSQASVEQAMAQVIRGFGELDVLVNNAGITIRSLAVDVTREEWKSVMDINLTGTFFMSQQMGRHLIAQKRAGCIVNISSTHGLVGFAQRSTYGISKAGISHMTRMLAIEWAEYGIRVNAVAPGTVATPSRVAFFSADTGGFKAMIDRVPLARLCKMEEVAGSEFTIPASYVRPKPLQRPRPPLLSGMWSAAGLERTRLLFDAWNPAGQPVERVAATVGDLNARRPEHLAPLDVYHRAFAQYPLQPTPTGDVVRRLAEEAVAARNANFNEFIIEHNFFDGISSPDDWAEVPDRFAAIITAVVTTPKT